MTLPLDGVTIVVTRPAAQATRFLALARAAGALCIPYPTLQIDRTALDDAARARLQSRAWDWAVFTSANAVESALEQCPAPLATRHAAVGRATARALEQRGIKVDTHPESANSEGLLALPEFAALAGRGVLLVKGSGGRELLRDALRARGADVLELEVYRRSVTAPTAAATAQLHAALTSPGPLVVVVTSVEVLKPLLEHVGDDDGARLRSRTLLVPGPRVAAAGERLGWTGPIVAAATAEDEAMLAALTDLAAGPSPPA
ncbi:MAG: uroporphyrinogen-III synthase [Gammaproteobacteria bacterium]|nr:uroporphyrinogen-III synthase [Gammaproteobacteria bacterium]MDH4310616.1 uroporphyrinogen-III synthase [Gammaproteobacteria bacterium]MDH5271812.1 uroporphyrinogen-III synthase [Gammaproteobacteria bacterium]